MAFTTRPSLLFRVRKGDEVSWTEFYEIYAKLIRLCGKDWLLRNDEIEDLVQQVMSEIFQKDIVGIYIKNNLKVPSDVTYTHDPAKGRFRDYLRRITRNKAVDLYNQRKKHEAAPIEDDKQVEDKVSSDEWDQLWDEEWQKHVYEMAMQELRGTVETDTFLAFDMYAVQHRPIKEVADFLSMKVSAIYMAKSRCMDNLKTIITRLNK